MRNIWKIFTTDIRRISNNVVAVVIVMGLSILPALYAWFNIFSNWDPYEPAATSQLKVAVASDDAGAEIMGLSLNVGDSVLEALEANTTIGWVFPGTRRSPGGREEQRLLCSTDHSGDFHEGNVGIYRR